MFVFAYPWLLALLALPLIMRLVPGYKKPEPAVRVPWFDRLAALAGDTGSPGSLRASFWRLVGLWSLWGCLVVGLARPQFLEPPVEKHVSTRDLLLLVDLSGSMEARDFENSSGEAVDRLSAVKEVLGDFLDRRQGDRVGLIVFGNAAFVQVPFTQDLEVCRRLLDETQVRMAGPRTAFGDAMGLGITLFDESEVEHRVMIALTDGNDTGSRIPPEEAARIASNSDITVHVVGVGDPKSVGEEKLDEEALRAVATAASGSYFHAADRDELDSIYDELDRLETREVETLTWRPRVDLFHYPLALFLCVGLVVSLGRLRPARKEGD